MAENPGPNRAPQGKPTEPWRIERMVQRVPGHLGEDSRFSPWLVVVAVGVVVIVGSLLLFFSNFSAGGAVPSDTTTTPRPRTTIIRVTATPEDTSTPTPVPTSPITRYTVKKGDTLSTVARQFKITVDAIRAVNKLTDDTIRVGDILIIPLPGPAPTPGAVAADAPPTSGVTNTPLVFQTPTLIAFRQTPSPAAPTTPTATPGVVPYIVRQGDTLLGIAAVFSTTVQSIIDLNKLDGPIIRAGETLTVPVGAWTATPTPTVFTEPTLTVTPQFSYPAPPLLSPKDGANLASGAGVVLMWASVGALSDDEYYVVHLAYHENGDEVDLPSYQVKEGTTLTLNSSPVKSQGPRQFSWYVLVVRGSGCGAASPAAVQPCAVSPVSETRTFTWN